MPENRRRNGLALEALSNLLAGELPGQDEFYGHQPPETLLPRFVDDTHPAAGDLLKQFVIAEGVEDGLLKAIGRLFLNDGPGRGAAKAGPGSKAQWRWRARIEIGRCIRQVEKTPRTDAGASVPGDRSATFPTLGRCVHQHVRWC